MDGLNRARRVVYLLAFGMLAGAFYNVEFVPSERWYEEAVLRSLLFAAAEFAVLIAILELFARFIPRRRSPLYLFVFALLPTLGVALMLLRATLYGRSIARWDSWHLLALFTVVDFVWFLLAAVLLSAIAWSVLYVADRARHIA